MLPLGETLQLLHFAVLEEGDIHLTEEGRRFVAAETEERKSLFAAALLAHVPLARMVRQVLDERWNHRASAVRFRDELEDHMSPDTPRIRCAPSSHGAATPNCSATTRRRNSSVWRTSAIGHGSDRVASSSRR